MTRARFGKKELLPEGPYKPSLVSTTTAGDTGMIMAASDDEKKSLQVIVGKGSSNETTIGITFGEKN